MATTLQEILSFENLTGVINDPKTGLPDVLPAGFMTPTRSVEGDTCKYRKVEGTRDTARLAHYGSASQRRQLKGISDVPIKLAHTVEHIVHDVATLMQLQNYENEQLQKMGKQEVARQTEAFRQRFVNLRLSCTYSILRYGAIYFDADGDLLHNSTNAVTTIDFSVAAANKDQIDGIIGASWATAGTDIIGDITAIKTKALQTTGYPLRHAFYGSNIVNYLVSNTAAKVLVGGAARLAEKFYGAEVPDFMGLQWHPIYDAFFVDADGTTREWFIGDNVIFTPEVSQEWWEVIQGTYPVPTNMNVGSDGAAVLSSSFAKQVGMFSYATVTTDPPGIKHVAGDTWLPVLKVPNSIFIADVVP